jgi:hypothetical protein
MLFAQMDGRLAITDSTGGADFDLVVEHMDGGRANGTVSLLVGSEHSNDLDSILDLQMLTLSSALSDMMIPLGSIGGSVAPTAISAVTSALPAATISLLGEVDPDLREAKLKQVAYAAASRLVSAERCKRRGAECHHQQMALFADGGGGSNASSSTPGAALPAAEQTINAIQAALSAWDTLASSDGGTMHSLPALRRTACECSPDAAFSTRFADGYARHCIHLRCKLSAYPSCLQASQRV